MEDFYSLVSVLKVTLQILGGSLLWVMVTFYFGCIGNYAYPRWFFFNWQMFSIANEIVKNKCKELIKLEERLGVESKTNYLDLISRLAAFYGLAYLLSLLLPAALFMSGGIVWLVICRNEARNELFPDKDVE